MLNIARGNEIASSVSGIALVGEMRRSCPSFSGIDRLRLPKTSRGHVSHGAALTSLSNVGPGFGAVNPAGNFAEFNCISKLLLALTMIIGRLELFTIIVLFLPSTWKK